MAGTVGVLSRALSHPQQPAQEAALSLWQSPHRCAWETTTLTPTPGPRAIADRCRSTSLKPPSLCNNFCNAIPAPEIPAGSGRLPQTARLQPALSSVLLPSRPARGFVWHSQSTTCRRIPAQALLLRQALRRPSQRKAGKELVSGPHCTAPGWPRALPPHSVCKTKRGAGPALISSRAGALTRAGVCTSILSWSPQHPLSSAWKCVNPLQAPPFSWKAVNPKINWSPCHKIINMGSQEHSGSVLVEKGPWEIV